MILKFHRTVLTFGTNKILGLMQWLGATKESIRHLWSLSVICASFSNHSPRSWCCCGCPVAVATLSPCTCPASRKCCNGLTCAAGPVDAGVPSPGVVLPTASWLSLPRCILLSAHLPNRKNNQYPYAKSWHNFSFLYIKSSTKNTFKK